MVEIRRNGWEGWGVEDGGLNEMVTYAYRTGLSAAAQSEDCKIERLTSSGDCLGPFDAASAYDMLAVVETSDESQSSIAVKSLKTVSYNGLLDLRVRATADSLMRSNWWVSKDVFK